MVLTPLWWNQALTRELQDSRSLPLSVWNLKIGKFNDLSSMYTCCRASMTWALLLLCRVTQNTSLAKSDGTSYSQRVVSHGYSSFTFAARTFLPSFFFLFLLLLYFTTAGAVQGDLGNPHGLRHQLPLPGAVTQRGCLQDRPFFLGGALDRQTLGFWQGLTHPLLLLT